MKHYGVVRCKQIILGFKMFLIYQIEKLNIIHAEKYEDKVCENCELFDTN